MTEPVADHAARERALDPGTSFIVQAPAGSGKTSLLTQRYLRLLALVEAPEEIIAITFTRKAAGEMRDRVLKALAAARETTPPEKPHARRSWELARAAAARDAERGWSLGEHPARLRIQTIDSLNAELTRQMPLLSGFGAPPSIAEQPEVLYREAAERTLALLDHGDAAQAEALGVLLRHLDNDWAGATELLADMLARRDQWLRHAARAGASRTDLQLAFAREIVRQLSAARAAFPAPLQAELAELAAFAGRALAAQGSESPLCACAGLRTFPAAEVASLPAWHGLAELLLTKSNGEPLRKTVNKNTGFAPEHPHEKARMHAVLQALAERPAMHGALRRVRKLPGADFDTSQWQALEALLESVRLGVAQLQVLFAERGEVDYAEVALRALAALGEEQAPTDLALALDYRIQHLLVDEFQDTSYQQFHLLERLTEGWQPGDGRTLFVVGDPMQSIYRFREAEVGLFLRAQQRGIGQVPLEPLTLSVNFRARPTLVEWVNAAFGRLFPAASDMASGALSYSPCTAQRAAVGGAWVQMHVAFDGDAEREAAAVIEVIRKAHADHLRAAVLVRGRNHLAALVPRLRREGVRFQATELEQLGERPVVRDLVSLTRALLHPGDRVAWLAVLRAPWCGLTLADLHALTSNAEGQTWQEILGDEARIATLSADGQARLACLRRTLGAAIAERRRASLREQVERVWLEITAPAVLGSLEDLADAEAFLTLLETMDEGGTLADPGALEAGLERLFAQPDPQAGDELQVMTMHKAKGLEFDVVIVPGLGAGRGRTHRPLMLYLERTRGTGNPDLLLAPLNPAGSDRDAYYELVLDLRGEQENFERQRLLYVAATRAREQLHWFGSVGFTEKDGVRELRNPSANSLLATLWPAVEAEYQRALQAYRPAGPAAEITPPVARLRRLPAGWTPPAPPADVRGLDRGALAREATPQIEFDWAGDTLRHIGTVVHRLLQDIATADGDLERAAQAALNAARMRAWLAQAGVPRAELESAAQTVREAVTCMLADADGRRLLAARGPDAHCEFALSGFEDQRLVTGVMDRTYVDADGVRWVVDYKTSRHEGADRAVFLAREAERYREQLARYVRLMRGFEDRPVKAALYFPLLGTLYPVDVDQR
ncbi:MAG: UvrD-helicase domain-containing protein [Gammaproteobacteria bacterium]